MLSELLQNADDAGATKAHAKISNNVFEFTHNGEDFNEESLRSLCRFGFSNKRHLHTIGFRGVGFKSTFSLGPQVEVHTPTLAFAFHNTRFTEPIWISNHEPGKETVIRVDFDKDSKESALLTEFDRWLDTPHPLLFFQNILKLKIQSQLIYKEVLGPGPTRNSEKIWLANPHKQEVLCFCSEPVDFPQEALEEIREERDSEGFEVPPFTVQIVFGSTAGHRLFTVLPTEVRLQVPFSVNGPFIQDPSRKEIKHPANSPTNTRLLQEIGRLTVKAIDEWLKNTELDLFERARAYKLFPKPIESDGSLDDESTRIIVEEFERNISEEQKILLAQDGSLMPKGQVVSLPIPILDTWEPETALSIFAPEMEKVFARQVGSDSQAVLELWGFLEILGNKDIADRLLSYGDPGPPCPQPLEGLVNLWSYIHSHSSAYYFDGWLSRHPIVPLANKKYLLPAEKVLVVGGKESRIGKDDWAFLIAFADILDPNWVRLLKGPGFKEDQAEILEKDTENVYLSAELFDKLKLNQKVGLEQVVAGIAEKIFSHDDPGEDGIKLAQIAARGDIRVSEHFKFICRDGVWRSDKSELIAGQDENLIALLPKEWMESHTISSDYENGLSEEDIVKWCTWISNVGKCKVHSFPLPKSAELSLYEVGRFCEERGGSDPKSYHYKYPKFFAQDYDWEKCLWEHWKERANEDPNFWVTLLLAVIRIWSRGLAETTKAYVKEECSKRYWYVKCGELRAAWLHKLAQLPCIPDTFGRPSIPAELCRSTADTRPLHNVERFVHTDFDKPKYEEALDLLGVRREAKSVEPLLDRLRSLSRADHPPITGVIDLYRAVDQVLLRMEPENAQSLKNIFAAESLTYSDDGTWEQLENVFKDNPDDIPGVRIIHPEARNLAMWDRLQVVERPTLEMAVQWLKSIVKGKPLLRSEKIRAIQIMRSAPSTVWNECGAWIDASGLWAEIRDLKWGATERRITHDLFDSTKRCVADFSILGESASEFTSKVGLSRLESALEQRIQNYSPASGCTNPTWIRTLGKTLARLRISENDSDMEETKSNIDIDRIMGDRLANSIWQPVLHLTMVPYLEGQPAGAERTCNVTWHDNKILIVGEPASIHRELVHEISRHFHTSAAREAVKDCIDRDAAWITLYAREHLDLGDAQYHPEILIDGEEESDQSEPDEFGGQAETGSHPVSEEDKEEDEEFEKIIRLRKKRQEGKKQIFIQFMRNQGFEWSDARRCLVHSDGTVIVKAESPFHWSASQNGTQKSLFWVGKGSMEEGVEIPSDVWNWPSNNKSETFIFLMDKDNMSFIHSLVRLQEQAKVGEIDLFSSKYIVRATGHPIEV